MFQILEDKEILASARGGDKEAAAKIITELMPSVKSAAKLHSSSSVPAADLVQEGLIGAVNAVLSFDEAKGVKFSTYAQACISNSIASAVRNSARKKHSVLNDYVPLEDAELIAGKDSDPEYFVSMNELIGAVYSCINTRLTELERRAILIYISEGSAASVARELGITQKAASNALSRARAKIRASL